VFILPACAESRPAQVGPTEQIRNHLIFSTERHLNSRRYMRQLRERAAREWKIAAA
jgi:hypothetical protein